jgi:tRNA threonylcarbamoyladenosine biosynthesis protein TsaE
VHAAGKASSQPIGKALLGLRQIDATDADLGESQLRSPQAHLLDERRGIRLSNVTIETRTGHRPILETRTLRWPDEAACAAFAQRLAAAAPVRDAFIELRGALGAGKTTFVRHLLRALGVAGRIKSPTYAVLEPYTLADGTAVSHLDFYRMADAHELA